MCKVATNNNQTRGCENPKLVAAAAWSLLVAVAVGAALQRGSGGDGAVPLSCQASAAETQRCGKCRSAVLGGGGVVCEGEQRLRTRYWALRGSPARVARTRQVVPLSGDRGLCICLLPQNGCSGRQADELEPLR